jgi:hypothetical protein
VCPESIPVAKGSGDLNVVVLNCRALQDLTQQRVSCNTTIHPTGRPGDEVCPYSSCDEGGDHSAICACIDLSQHGLGDGMEWICMHSTCSCGDEEFESDKDVLEGSSGSSSTMFSMRSSMVLAAAIAALF